MSSHDQAAHPHGDLDNADVHHEESDINVRAIIWFVVVLTVIVLAVDVAMWGMFRLLNHYEAENEPVVTPLARPAGQQPSGPRAADDAVDRSEAVLRAQEHAYLNSYGWVDETPGRRARSDREGEGDAAEEGHSRSSRARGRDRRHAHPGNRRVQQRTYVAGRAARSIDGAVRIARPGARACRAEVASGDEGRGRAMNRAPGPKPNA